MWTSVHQLYWYWAKAILYTDRPHEVMLPYKKENELVCRFYAACSRREYPLRPFMQKVQLCNGVSFHSAFYRNRARIDVCIKGTVGITGQGCVWDISNNSFYVV